MFKRYLLLAVSLVVINLVLVFASWLKLFPLSNLIVLSWFFLGGVILAFFYPREVFGWLVSSLALENVFLTGKNFPVSLHFYQFLAIVLFGGILMRKLVGKKDSFLNLTFWRSLKNKKNLDWLSLTVFSFSFFFSLGGWQEKTLIRENIQWFLIVVSFVFIFWLARNFLSSPKEKAEGLFFFLLSGAVVWLAGMYQALAMRLGGTSFVVMDGRINSSFLEPDWLGVYAVAYLGVLLGLKVFFFEWRNGKKLFLGQCDFPNFLNKILSWKIFLWAILIALTVSRSAWLASLVIILFYGLWIAIMRKNIFSGGKEVLLLGLIFIFAFGLTKIGGLSKFDFFNRAISTVDGEQKITISCQKEQILPEKINQMSELTGWGCRHINLEEIDSEKKDGFFVAEINRPDPNINLRKEIYIKIWQAIKQHPWLGQGWGASGRILGQDEQGNGLNASNIFLEILLATGAGGLLIFLLVLFWAGKYIFSWPLSWQGLVMFPLLAFLIANLFNAGIFLGFFWVFLAGISFNEKK